MEFRATHKRQRGVSPIVATVLLVAITVVLASVLYVLVAGLGSGATGPRPIALELTALGNLGNPGNVSTWVNFSLTTSQTVTTSEFGLALTSPGGVYVSAGKGGCFATISSCSPGNGWIALLLNPQGDLLNLWNASGWGNGTVSINSSITLGFVAAQSLHVGGSSYILRVTSKAQPTIVGQSSPF